MCYLNIVKKREKYMKLQMLYFEALTQAKSQEDIDRLGKRLAELEAEYSENPAYMAWYISSIWNRNGSEKNETNK